MACMFGIQVTASISLKSSGSAHGVRSWDGINFAVFFCKFANQKLLRGSCDVPEQATEPLLKVTWQSPVFAVYNIVHDCYPKCFLDAVHHRVQCISSPNLEG
jgi:hypothetical protein